MTRKDFVAIASVLKDHKQDGEGAAILAYKFACLLAQQHPAFDRAKFLKACGVAA